MEMRLLNLEQSRNDLGGRLVSQDKRLEEEKKQFGVIDENVKKIEEETASSRREKISLDEQIKEAAKIITAKRIAKNAKPIQIFRLRLGQKFEASVLLSLSLSLS